MNEIFEKIKSFYANNKILALVIAGAAVFFLFGKKLFAAPRRRRRRAAVRVAYRPRRRNKIKVTARRRRTPGTKKPWQIKGSEAARRYMARLRRMKR